MGITTNRILLLFIFLLASSPVFNNNSLYSNELHNLIDSVRSSTGFQKSANRLLPIQDFIKIDPQYIHWDMQRQAGLAPFTEQSFLELYSARHDFRREALFPAEIFPTPESGFIIPKWWVSMPPEDMAYLTSFLGDHSFNIYYMSREDKTTPILKDGNLWWVDAPYTSFRHPIRPGYKWRDEQEGGKSAWLDLELVDTAEESNELLQLEQFPTIQRIINGIKWTSYVFLIGAFISMLLLRQRKKLRSKLSK